MKFVFYNVHAVGRIGFLEKSLKILDLAHNNAKFRNLLFTQSRVCSSVGRAADS